MLSVLAFMIFSQASELHHAHRKKSSSSISYSAPSPFLKRSPATGRPEESEYGQNHGVGEEAIFTTQSRDPLAPLSEAKPYSLFTGICEIIRSTVLFDFCGWQEGSTRPGDAGTCREFLLESNSGESQELPLSVTLHCRLSNMGGYSAVLHYLSS